MATTKPKKPATRKTTKPKTASKASVKRTAKASNRSVAVKAAPKRAVKKTTATTTSTSSLNRIWLAAAVLFLGLAVAAPLLMQPVSYLMTQTHLTSDSLLSQDGTTFIPASRAVWDLELRWALSVLMAASAILPILYLTKLKDRYTDRVNGGRVVEWRWIDLAISSALMVEIVGVLVGYTDVGTLKLMAGAMVLTCGLGWLAEQQNDGARRPVWSAFGLSVIAGIMPWVVIGTAKASTLLFGEVRSPWYVYAACLTALIGFSLLAFNQWNQHRRFGPWANYATVERNYALLSIATKVAFAAILIAGLAK